MRKSHLFQISILRILIAAGLTLMTGCGETDSTSSEVVQKEIPQGKVDTVEARKIVNQFYLDLEQKDYDILSAQFSGRTSKEDAIKFFNHLDTAMGKVEKFEILKITGTPADSGRSTYNVFIEGSYEKCKTHDNLVVVIGGNGHTFDRFVSIKNDY